MIVTIEFGPELSLLMEVTVGSVQLVLTFVLASFTVKEIEAGAEEPAELEAVMEAVKEPVAVGVPEITPEEVLRERPAGREPEERAKEVGAPPPEVMGEIEKNVFFISGAEGAV